MTAIPALLGGFTPISDHNPIPGMLARKLAANEQIGKGQFATVNPSTGFAALNDGTVPNEIAVGNGDVAELSDKSATGGAAVGRFSERWFYGLAQGASADGFTDADFGVPFFIGNENTLGKKSNDAGKNRSLGGLVFGLAFDGTPVAWSGVVAHLLARATLVTQAKVGAWYSFADAAANAATAETAIHREKLHGLVTGIEFVGAAVAADNTDYVTVTVSKRDGAGGAAVVLGTYDSRAANQGAISAFQAASFSLSAVAGALNLLETDIVTITVAKGGAGKTLTGAVRLVQKVI